MEEQARRRRTDPLLRHCVSRREGQLERRWAISGAPKPHRDVSGVCAAALLLVSMTIRVCTKCRHYRIRPKPVLFDSAELQTAGGLKARSEWQQQEKQHAEREAQLVAADAAFMYEPHHYAWCAAYTRVELVSGANAGDAAALAELMRHGGGSLNPVTGEVTPIYALCLRMNPRGACERHEAR